MPPVVALPIPNSWYAVPFSADLRPGAVVARTLADREIQPPALAQGDGPIGAFRVWARQFYPAEAQALVALTAGSEMEKTGG